MGRIDCEREQIRYNLQRIRSTITHMVNELDDEREALAYGKNSNAKIGNVYGAGGVHSDRVGEVSVRLATEFQTDYKNARLLELHLCDLVREYEVFVNTLTPLERLAYDEYKLVQSRDLLPRASAEAGHTVTPRALREAYFSASGNWYVWFDGRPIKQYKPAQ